MNIPILSATTPTKLHLENLPCLRSSLNVAHLSLLAASTSLVEQQQQGVFDTVDLLLVLLQMSCFSLVVYISSAITNPTTPIRWVYVAYK